MAKNTFDMRYRKEGQLKYLALTFLPPIAVLSLCYVLALKGLIPESQLLANLIIFIPLGSIVVVGYFTILKKQHSIEVKDNTLTEKNWRGNVITKIKTVQIACYRTNFLGEIILLGKNGTKLLCIESSMTNRDRFEQWLASHNIESK